jgi:hypothetical protein
VNERNRASFMSGLSWEDRRFASGPPPPADDADAQVKATWLRDYLRSHAEVCAALVVSGFADSDEQAEDVLIAAGEIAWRIGWPAIIAQAAYEASWAAALAKARDTRNRVEKAVWWPLKRREPGSEVLARARAADPNVMFPDSALIEFCAGIAKQGAQRRVRT